MISIRGIFGNPKYTIKQKQIFIPANSDIHGDDIPKNAGTTLKYIFYADLGNTSVDRSGDDCTGFKKYMSANNILYVDFKSGNIHLDNVRPSSRVYTLDESVTNTYNTDRPIQYIIFHDSLTNSYDSDRMYTPSISFIITTSGLYIKTNTFNNKKYNLGTTITVYYI